MVKSKLFTIIILILIVINKLPKKTENIEFETKNDIVASIEIPKINLKKELYDINSEYNDVDKNLMIIGDMPSTDGKFILAGHSGEGEIAYFNELNHLQINDQIYVYYNDKTYNYSIIEIYDIEKTGKLYLSKNENGIIILITCRIGTNNQTVYKGILTDLK